MKGATGCGKTTKVPQFILDDAIARGRGAYCNIAVCLPRKLTAKETARYVAACRWEPVSFNAEVVTFMSINTKYGTRC